MISETVYLKRISEHVSWHHTEQGEPPVDLSCKQCHPATEEYLTEAFRNFWNFWIIFKWAGQTYTKYTCHYFQQACTATNENERNIHIRSIVKTIRYKQLVLPGQFDEIEDSIKTYWRYTSLEINSEISSRFSESGKSSEPSEPSQLEINSVSNMSQHSRRNSMDNYDNDVQRVWDAGLPIQSTSNVKGKEKGEPRNSSGNNSGPTDMSNQTNNTGVIGQISQLIGARPRPGHNFLDQDNNENDRHSVLSIHDGTNQQINDYEETDREQQERIQRTRRTQIPRGENGNIDINNEQTANILIEGIYNWL